MKIIYEHQKDGRYHSGLQKLSLLLVMMLFGFTTAFAQQTLTNNGPICAGNQLVLIYNSNGCNPTSVQFTGPSGYNVAGTNIGSGQWRAVRNLTISSHSGIYTATPTGGTCNVQTTNAVINALPSTPTITGANNLCGLNNVVDYSIGAYNLSGKTAAWSIAGGNAYIVSGQNSTTITVNWGNASPTGSVNVTITETSTGCFVTTTNYIVNIWAEPTVYNTVSDPADGLYCDGDPGVKIGLNNQEWNATTPVTYVLKQDGLPVAWHTPTSGDAGSSFWFNISGNQYFTGDGTVEFTVEAQTTYCNQFQNNSIYPEQYANAVADAGSGGDVCSDDLTSDLFTFTAAAASTSGSGTSTPTGLWTYSGPGNATFGDITDPATSVEVDAFGAYTFTWTVTNGPCVDSDAVTVNFYEKPALLFAVNNTDVLTTGSTWEYCYDENIEVSLNSIVAGTAPFTLKWDVFVDGSPTPSLTYSNSTGLSVTNVGDVVWGPGILPAGSYDFELTSLVDANGCSPTDVSLYNSTIVIHPEPTLTIDVVDDGMNVLTSPYAFCYDGAFGISIAGDDGTGPWDFDYKITGPNSYELTGNLSGTSGVVAIDLTDGYDPGTYTFEITSLSDVHCTATAATIGAYEFEVEVYAEPTLSLTIGGTSIIGTDLEYCYDDNIEFTIAGGDGVATWTFDWQVEYAAGGIVLGFQFTNDWVNTPENKSFSASALTPGDYKVKITSLEDGNGCVASSATIATYWLNLKINPKPNPFFTIDGNVLAPNATIEYCEDGLTEINIAITGTEGPNTDPGTAPYDIAFDIRANDGLGAILGSYTLNDVAYNTATNLLALVPAWYTVPGTYYIDVTSLVDDNGCEISAGDYPYYEFTLIIYEQPVADAGNGSVCWNQATFSLTATASVGTGLWTKTSGPGTATFDDDTAPTTDVTVDVAGTYTFTWTETNGLCTDDDSVDVTFVTGTQANAATLSAVDDIYTIPETPFLVELQAIFPDLTGTDPLILSDALIEYNGAGTFPAGATIRTILYKETGMPNFINIPVVAGNIGGESEVYLSDVVNNANTLVYHTNKTIDWKIYIEGVNAIPVPDPVPVKISIVSYLTGNKACHGVQAFNEFDIYTGDVTISEIAHITECYPTAIQYSYTEQYPLIDNIGGNEVLNDGKFTFWADAALSVPASLPIGTKITVTTPIGNTKISTLSVAAHTVYGSAVVAQQANPTTNEFGYLLSLERTAATHNWTVKIENAPPGTIYVKYDNIAVLNINAAGYPYTEEYVYNTQDFKVNYVGSNGVTINPIADVETVTGAPVIIPFTVNYALESNIDDSVLEDALFEVDAAVTILQITYGGSPQLGGPVAVAANTATLLSDIMGSTPYPLNYQPGSTALWSVTVVADAATAQTVTASILSIAYVDFDECYSELDEATVTVTWADFVQATATTPAIVCDGSDVTGSSFTIEYPTISGNPASILADAEITCDEIIPAGVDIIWGYNAAPSTTYTLPAALNAGEVLKLSTIVGSSAPLNGHSGLTDVWNFTFSGLSALAPGNFYEISVQPIATLNSVDYDESTSNTPITQKIEIYGVPDATISGDAEVFSGSTHTYSVAEHLYGTATYSWSSDQSSSDVVITNSTDREPSIEFVWPFTGTVVLTATVNNGVCDDEQTFEVEVKPNILAGQLKYYNSQESPMPSPFMVDFLGIQVPGYFWVELYSMSAPQTLIEEVMVQEIYGEENDLLDDDVYEAAFMFDYNLDPTEGYFVVVYDDEVGFFASTDAGYWTMNNWGGVTAVDALFVQHMAAGNQINGFPNMSHIGANNLTPAYGFFANGVGDVNSSGAFTALDALLTSRRAVGLIPFFTNNTPNFRVAGKFVDETDFNTPAVFGTTLPDIDFQRDEPASSSYESVYFGEFAAPLGVGVHFLNIYYNATGDVNSSYVPAYGGFKAAPVMDLIFEGEIAATVGQEVTLPITLDNYTHLGAMGLGLNYRNDLIEVIGTSYGEDYARIDHENGTVAIAWADINGVSFDVDDAIVQLTVRILQPIAPGTRLYELNGFTELAEVDATIIYDVNFKSIGLNTSGVNGDFTTNVYPNPFNQQSVISYTLPEAGKVNVTIFNKLGQVVTTMVSESQAAGEDQVNVNSTDLSGPGMYYYKVEFDGETQHLSATNNMILIR
jgi:hypothetical protein